MHYKDLPLHKRNLRIMTKIVQKSATKTDICFKGAYIKLLIQSNTYTAQMGKNTDSQMYIQIYTQNWGRILDIKRKDIGDLRCHPSFH